MIDVGDLIVALNQKQIQTNRVVTPRGHGLVLECIFKNTPVKALLLCYCNNEYFKLEIASEQVVGPDYYFVLTMLLIDLTQRHHSRRWRILDTGEWIVQVDYYADDINELVESTIKNLKVLGKEFYKAYPHIEGVASGQTRIMDARNRLRSLGLLK